MDTFNPPVICNSYLEAYNLQLFWKCINKLFLKLSLTALVRSYA